MRLEDLAQQIGHLQGTLDGMKESQDEMRDEFRRSFDKGSRRMDGIDEEIGKLKTRSWKHLIALVVVAITFGKASPWIWHLLKIPMPPQ